MEIILHSTIEFSLKYNVIYIEKLSFNKILKYNNNISYTNMFLQFIWNS